MLTKITSTSITLVNNGIIYEGTVPITNCITLTLLLQIQFVILSIEQLPSFA